ncbi:MAG: ATP-binding protein [Acidobacteriota bacterium]|nr:ATP-binding protein [Acidobacteriota bacterium]MDD8039931.1 ATP-binding protein [Acidobacteriota bacterium]HNT33037.1 ATP-binding protein [Candidatus Aminicenantes bacterium]
MGGQIRTKRNFLFFLLSILAGVVILAVAVYGFSLLRHRSGIPAEIDRSVLVQIDETEIKAPRDEEFALAGKRPGRPADFHLRTPDGGVRKQTLPLVPYYARTIYLTVYLIIGLACIAIALFAFLLRPDDRKARIYYWLSLAFGSAVIISGEFYCVGRAWTTYVPSILFILGYAAAPALFLDFALAFSRSEKSGRRALRFMPAAVIAAVQTAVFLAAFLKPSIAMFRAYNAYYFIFRVYVIIYVVLAVWTLYRTFRKSADDEERTQVQWIFFGLAAGIVPFVFLYQIPTALGIHPPITEEFAAFFYIAIPVTFFVAIVKYRLMNIHLIINRGLVYSILTVFTVSVYFAVIESVRKLFAGLVTGRDFIVTAAGVFLAALAFQPAQRWIQTAVDKAFFRQRYDYRRTVMAFNEGARTFVDRNDLFDYFRREIMRVLPLESLEVGPETAENETEFRLPLSLDPKAPPSFLAFGRKKSGRRYSLEDKELLRTMSGGLQVNLDRIRLQEEVIYERAALEKMKELDRLKTEFISTVSHELRTPLSSIQSMAELLESGRIRERDKRDKFLASMAAECARLSRFLHNILDYGKIERRAAVFHFQPAVLQDVIKEAVELFRPLLETRGFRFELDMPAESVCLDVDADAVKQALSNLIDNAIKYSRGRKSVRVELVDGGRTWDIRVGDEGIGIAADDIEKIFRKFYRSPRAGKLCPEGAGLGLKIVRHIMDAHEGEARAESKEGEGSRFTLAFPKAKKT